MRRFLVAAFFGMGATLAVSAQTILLDDFNFGSVGFGAIRAGTSWAGAGNVIQNATTITVGNTALNDSGWGTISATIDATGMQFIVIVAQVDAGNLAPSLVVGFEDSNLHSQTFSVSTFSFTSGMTTVEIPISSWGSVDPTGITGWRIGGGTAGVVGFRMTFDNLSLSASAIPEPGSFAALTAALALGFAAWRRRLQRT